MTSMKTIARDTLKERLDSGEAIRLVMALDEWAFRAKHIPGSIWVRDAPRALDALDPADEIVVYCSGPDCAASRIAYAMLTAHGYHNVSRYEGGLLDWEDAGYPLEGALVD